MQTKYWENRKGQVLVIFAMGMLPLMIALLAMLVDVGHVVATRVNLQNAADAATLAAAQVLMEQRSAGADEAQARAAALAEAQILADDNGTEDGTLTLEFGGYQEGQFVVWDSSRDASAVRATIERDDNAPGGSVELLFSGIVGLRSVDVNGAATSQVGDQIVGVSSDLAPFAIPKSKITRPGDLIQFYPAGNSSGNNGNSANNNNGNQNGVGREQTAPGNWGLLNLNGGSNSNHEIAGWIRHGYNGGITLPGNGELWVGGTPGFRASNEDDVQWRIDHRPQAVMCVYDEVRGQGANTQYRIVGFLVCTLIEARLRGNDKHLTCRIDRVATLDNVELGSGGESSVNIRKIQLTE